MNPKDLERAMELKCKEDVEFASLTWAERSQQIRYREQMRKIMGIAFTVIGLVCGVGSLLDTMMLILFGILGPIMLRYDMLCDMI